MTAVPEEKIGLGLKGRLQLAFSAITLLVMIATGVGLYAFFQVGKSLQRITEEALPPALAASELSIRAEFIVGVGPALLASNNTDEINSLSASVAGELLNVTKILDQLRRADLDKAVLDTIGEAISNLGSNLALLQATTLEKVSAETRREALVEATFAAHREFDAIWEPRFADMRSKVLRLQRALVSPNESQQDRRAELNSLDQAILALLPLEQIRRDFSLTFEIALRASTTNDPQELGEVQESGATLDPFDRRPRFGYRSRSVDGAVPADSPASCQRQGRDKYLRIAPDRDRDHGQEQAAHRREYRALRPPAQLRRTVGHQLARRTSTPRRWLPSRRNDSTRMFFFPSPPSPCSARF